MAIEHARNLRALELGAQRAADLLRSIPDVNVRIPNSEWTISEAAAHIITSVRTYGSWATGAASPEQLGLSQKQINTEIARVNDARIATIDRSDGKILGDQLLEVVTNFVRDAAPLSGDRPFEWYDQIPMDMQSMTCIELAEVLVHTWDIAKATGKPWPIDAKDAEQMMLGALALTPHYVNKETTKGVKASFDIRVRGGARIGIRLDGGVATIQIPPDGDRYDCIISAEPVALLLVSYGRIGLAAPVLTGKLFAYGRKPWLGLKFNSYFLKP